VRERIGVDSWPKRRYLCSSCRRAPFTKGWWKYVDKAEAKKMPRTCRRCGHTLVEHSTMGCPITTMTALGPVRCGCATVEYVSVTVGG